MSRITLVMLVSAFLAACAAEVKGPSAEIKSPFLTLDHGHGGFCPPGQAKKGNC